MRHLLGQETEIDELRERVENIKSHNAGCMGAEKRTVRAGSWMGNKAPWNDASRDKFTSTMETLGGQVNTAINQRKKVVRKK